MAETIVERAHAACKSLLGDVGQRAILGERVKVLLEADPRVLSVVVGGSLESGAADLYSDIDLSVIVAPEVRNRAFSEDIPALLAPIGPLLIEGWALRILPDRYSRTIYFADYPLFWHVDIGCRGGEHTDGSDILADYHATRFFKTWQETLKGYLRGKTDNDPDFIERMLARWVRFPETPGENPHDKPIQQSAGERLAGYLEACREQAIEEWQAARERSEFQGRYGFDVEKQRIEDLYTRCDELRQATLRS